MRHYPRLLAGVFCLLLIVSPALGLAAEPVFSLIYSACSNGLIKPCPT